MSLETPHIVVGTIFFYFRGSSSDQPLFPVRTCNLLIATYPGDRIPVSQWPFVSAGGCAERDQSGWNEALRTRWTGYANARLGIGNVRLDDARSLFYLPSEQAMVLLCTFWWWCGVSSRNGIRCTQKCVVRDAISSFWIVWTQNPSSFVARIHGRQLRVINEGPENGSRPRLLMWGIKDNVQDFRLKTTMTGTRFALRVWTVFR